MSRLNVYIFTSLYGKIWFASLQCFSNWFPLLYIVANKSCVSYDYFYWYFYSGMIKYNDDDDDDDRKEYMRQSYDLMGWKSLVVIVVTLYFHYRIIMESKLNWNFHSCVSPFFIRLQYGTDGEKE